MRSLFFFVAFLSLLWLLLVPSAIPAPESGNSDQLTLSTNRIRLGRVGAPEWEWFAADPPSAATLQLKFNAQSNGSPATLFIRQDDVRQEWPVQLNGRRLGQLQPMEADLTHHLLIPPGALKDGENLLTIGPSKEPDDIILHELRIDSRPPAEAIADGMLSVNVTDEAGAGLPCRLTIIEQRSGTLAPLFAPTNRDDKAFTPLAVRPGVVYTGSGRAIVGIPAGHYTIYGSRGVEWSVRTQHVAVAHGETTSLTFGLRREVATPGFISCDTHVHTFTHSRHGDVTAEERMLTLAGEGIELPIATEHNLQVDFRSIAQEQGVADRFTTVTGNEVTTTVGHFNIFPVAPDATAPDSKITDWPRLMSVLRATPGVRVVILNHPRNVHTQFQPFASTNFNPVTGDNLRGPEFSFDAMELLNSSAQQSDYLLVFHDWMALLNHGYRITAVGSSDSHDVSRYIVGQGRTYIACPDFDPGRLDVAWACSNLVAGHATVSMGLLANIRVADRFTSGDLAIALPSEIKVEVEVLGPSWVNATNVTLFANGVRIREQAIGPADAVGTGVKAIVQWTIARPMHDVHLVALATGPGMVAPFWAIPKPYQPTSRSWTSRVIAVTNPVWLDADGDGRFSSPREYARELLGRHRTKWPALFDALASYDEAVAAQAAGIIGSSGDELRTDTFLKALTKAAPPVRRGFESFIATTR